MRLIATLLWNLLSVLSWPIRALVRRVLARSTPEWIELRLAGELSYQRRRAGWLARRFSGPGRSASLEEIDEVFGRAISNPRCHGVLLRIDRLTGSWAKMSALAGRIEGMRKAGREVAVWSEALDARQYAGLCGATRLFLPPSGLFDPAGPGIELLSAGAAMAKVGIRPIFQRREEHKTAPELITRVEPSLPQRETARGLLDEAHAHLRSAFARRLSSAGVEKALALGPITGRGAAEAGFIDEVAFPDELAQRLSPSLVKLGSPKQLRSAAPALRPLRRPALVALVSVSGLIRSGRSAKLPTGGRFCGSDSMAQLLEAMRRSRSVKAILLHVDSGGGSASASELIWREVARAAKEKPVVAYIDAVAASGGYFAACGAGSIVAAPLAIVGSIGVFYGRFDPTDGLGRLGIHREVLRTSATSGFALPWSTPSSDELAAADRLVGALYEEFLAVVAASRHRSIEEIRALAGGRVYSGTRAAQLGLVDQLGGFRDALQNAARLAGIQGTPRLQSFEAVGRGPASWLSALTAGAVAEPMALHLGPFLS
ncbi:MAG: S49 family peptidase [Deltaproteobacteria bacterium]